ncbi:MAG: hypothetical protein P4M01_08150 [Acidobacteriota bacterium]|nr:hypothetical protein [Acidobacteriota bacterium]
MKKTIAVAVFGLLIATGVALPSAAQAQISVGVQMGGPAVVFTSGYHDGYYYEDGYRYQRDSRGYRHYDRAYGEHRDWKHDRAHRDGNHHDEHHPDGDHRDWRR